jgi:AcrR family transcriptional regulator
VSPSVNPVPHPPEVLPKGPHGLPAQVVRASQRARILRAMLGSVSERGYGATTVPDVVARAKVSRNAFYALFVDKEDCFLTLCDEFASEMLAHLARPTAQTWRETLRAGILDYLRWWQERPAFSRAYLVELPHAGSRAVEQRDRQYARFRELFAGLGAWVRAEDPTLAPLNPLATRAIVLAVTEILAEEVRAGRSDGLTNLAGDIAHLIQGLLTNGSRASSGSPAAP